MVSKRRSDGGIKACVLHDLLRDLCFKKCEEESFMNFVKENDRSSIYAKCHRLQDLDRNVVPPIYCQHLRSFHGRFLISNSESFYVRDLRLLRVLHFDLTNSHYFGIEYLFSLRYLVVSVLPPSIGSLVNLEYLRVETLQREQRVYLPPAIMKMKLRYIHVLNYNQFIHTYAAYGEDWDVSQTNNLEFLCTVVIAQLKDEEILKCSPHLRKLKCIYEEALVSMIEAPRHVDISSFTQLESLNVCFRGYTMLEKISFPSSIKKLTLSGNFIRPWKEMSVIGRLENLEVLKLREIWSFMGLGDEWDTKDGEFEKLRYLEINYANLRQWNVASSQHFPRLEQLLLRSCYKMEEIPSEIGEITTLQLIEVRGQCQESMVESARRIQQEQWDMGNDELRIDVSEYWDF